MEIRARETARVSFGSANPVRVTVAAPFVEPLLMAAQVCGSGFQVCAAACSGVRGGGVGVGDSGIVTVAAPFVEPLLMAAQVCGSGFQVCAAGCSGVRVGGTAPTQRGSISPTSDRKSTHLNS